MSRYREHSGERRSPRERDFGYRREDNYRGGGSRGRDRFSGRSLPAPKPSRVLGVFGLSRLTEERDLYDIMSQHGQVDDIQVVYDNLTGASRGFAFVYFTNVEDARTAHAACARGLEIHGRDIRVDFSLTQAAHKSTPGVYMGKEKRRFGEFGGGRGGGERRFPPRRRSRSRSNGSPPRRRRHASNSRSRSPRRPPMSRSPSPDPRMRRNGGGGGYHERPPRVVNRGWSERSESPR